VISLESHGSRGHGPYPQGTEKQNKVAFDEGVKAAEEIQKTLVFEEPEETATRSDFIPRRNDPPPHWGRNQPGTFFPGYTKSRLLNIAVASSRTSCRNASGSRTRADDP